MTVSALLSAGQIGAAHLLLPLWYIPVQQCERKRRKTHSGTDLFCLVFAAGSKQSLQESALLLPVRICTYPFLPSHERLCLSGDSQSDALSSVATVNTQPVAVGHGRSLTTSAVQGQCTLLETPQLSSSIFTAGCSVQFYVSGPASGLLVFEECQLQPQKFLCAGNIFCY